MFVRSTLIQREQKVNVCGKRNERTLFVHPRLIYGEFSAQMSFIFGITLSQRKQLFHLFLFSFFNYSWIRRYFHYR